MRPILLALLACTVSAAQSNTVSVCGVDLLLGSGKPDTLDRVGRNCALRKQAQFKLMDYWCVDTEGSKNCVNRLDFREGKLQSVQKDLGSLDGDDAAGLLEVFISEVEESIPGKTKIDQQGISPKLGLASVTITRFDINNRTRQLIITIGSKTLTLQSTRSVGHTFQGSYILIDESM